MTILVSFLRDKVQYHDIIGLMFSNVHNNEKSTHMSDSQSHMSTFDEDLVKGDFNIFQWSTMLCKICKKKQQKTLFHHLRQKYTMEWI